MPKAFATLPPERSPTGDAPNPGTTRSGSGLRPLLAVLGVTALLAGCAAATIAEPVESAILVEPSASHLLLRSPAERLRLRDFLMKSSGGRLDAVHVTVVGSSPGLRHATVGAVRSLGVEAGKVRQVHGLADAGGRYPLRVVALRYHAVPPHCPPLLVAGPSPDANDFNPTLGCSDLANLALQVNDPRDLIRNPVVVPADGERAATPVSRYRLFGEAPSAGGASRGSAATNAGPATTTP